MKQNVYEWCVENDRYDILERWDYDLNSFTPNEISISSKEQFYLKCGNNIHKSSLFQTYTLKNITVNLNVSIVILFNTGVN